MSPSHVAEPTYEAIRQRLKIGAWPMGFRLEAGRLAEDLGVSITPVRDALNRLVGEKLVDLVPGIGFHVPHLTERGLRELLDLNLLLLLGAVRIGAVPNGSVAIEAMAHDHAARTEALFARIASLSRNTELLDAVLSLGARLHAVRLHEIVVLQSATDDLALIEAAGLARGDRLSSALKNYHQVRMGVADRLIACVRTGGAV